jgi:hypothetical protein
MAAGFLLAGLAGAQVIGGLESLAWFLLLSLAGLPSAFLVLLLRSQIPRAWEPGSGDDNGGGNGDGNGDGEAGLPRLFHDPP